MKTGDQVRIVDGPEKLIESRSWMFFVRDKEGRVLQVQAEMEPAIRGNSQLFVGRVALAGPRQELMTWIDDVLCTYDCSSGKAEGTLEAPGLYETIFRPSRHAT